MSPLLELTAQANGHVTSSQATKAGIPRRKLAEAVAVGKLVRIAAARAQTTCSTWGSASL